MKKNAMRFGQWLMIIPLILILASCQKYKDDFGGITPPSDPTEQPVLKSTGAVNGDTIKSLPDMVLTIWVENLPVLPAGQYYYYAWTAGDGGPLVTTPRLEHQYAEGLYFLTVAITHPLTGNVTTLMSWVKISPNYGVDNIIVVISSSPASGGGYNYTLGFLSTTIAGFQAPPYTQSNIPFVTGTFCNWQTTPPPPNPDYATINGEIYLTRTFVFQNNAPQDLHFGQITNWSYGPNSSFWVPTGPGSGKYVIYPYNGQIYNFPPGTTYYPGEDGDEIGGIYPPTVRDSLMLGVTTTTDSLRIYINHAQYASGTQPFLSFSHLGNWSNTPLHLISNTGWGYYTFAISNIKLDNDRLYFKFGPNLSSPTVYGDMTHSKFYDIATEMCGLQIASLKSSGRQYVVKKI